MLKECLLAKFENEIMMDDDGGYDHSLAIILYLVSAIYAPLLRYYLLLYVEILITKNILLIFNSVYKMNSIIRGYACFASLWADQNRIKIYFPQHVFSTYV